MTLLEGMVALVILGLSAVGFLELFQGGARSTRDAEAWTRAVAFAESGMEAALIGGDVRRDAENQSESGDLTRRIEVAQWRSRVDEIRVTVTGSNGAVFTLRRLRRVR